MDDSKKTIQSTKNDVEIEKVITKNAISACFKWSKVVLLIKQLFLLAENEFICVSFWNSAS